MPRFAFFWEREAGPFEYAFDCPAWPLDCRCRRKPDLLLAGPRAKQWWLFACCSRPPSNLHQGVSQPTVSPLLPRRNPRIYAAHAPPFLGGLGRPESLSHLIGGPSRHRFGWHAIVIFFALVFRVILFSLFSSPPPLPSRFQAIVAKTFPLNEDFDRVFLMQPRAAPPRDFFFVKTTSPFFLRSVEAVCCFENGRPTALRSPPSVPRCSDRTGFEEALPIFSVSWSAKQSPPC